jgi:tetratricopeptide (TPR) repeat protein
MRRQIAVSMALGLVALGAPAARAQDSVIPAAPVQLVDLDASETVTRAAGFVSKGEAEFKAGHYTSAVQAWRHALVDDPKNGGVVLMLSQGLLAVGQYDEAAGSAQYALSLLPADKWGTVVTRYKELYGNYQDYTDELKRLEKARDTTPESPALHFLLGYHFGYLGYPKHAVKELDKTIELAPKDDTARKLLEIFKPQVKDSPAQPPSPSTSDAAPGSGAAAPPAGSTGLPPVAGDTTQAPRSF